MTAWRANSAGSSIDGVSPADINATEQLSCRLHGDTERLLRFGVNARPDVSCRFRAFVPYRSSKKRLTHASRARLGWSSATHHRGWNPPGPCMPHNGLSGLRNRSADARENHQATDATGRSRSICPFSDPAARWKRFWTVRCPGDRQAKPEPGHDMNAPRGQSPRCP